MGAPHLDLTGFLRQMPDRGASDLLLVAGRPPMFGIAARWIAADALPLQGGDIATWLRGMLTPAQSETLAEVQDLDFAVRLDGVGRFRVNAHIPRGSPAAAIRAIPAGVPALETLALPARAERLIAFPHGLVLVAGGTGHGKSTTLAALLGRLNDTRACHIITREDPIELEFPPGRAIIEQREVAADTPSFAQALRHVVRQRPDVILIGEMRDLETISTALTAAETGHLVLASLHTSNTSQTLSRIIDVYPPAQQHHVRTQLAASLRAILCEVLLPRSDGTGLTPAVELLFANDAVRRAVRDNETHLIYGVLETGRTAGMCTLEQSLADGIGEGRFTIDAARQAAVYPDRLERLLNLAKATTGRPEEVRTTF